MSEIAPLQIPTKSRTAPWIVEYSLQNGQICARLATSAAKNQTASLHLVIDRAG